jgi:hypothetical protein
MRKWQLVERTWMPDRNEWHIIKVHGIYPTLSKANKALIEEYPRINTNKSLAVIPRETDKEGESFG